MTAIKNYKNLHTLLDKLRRHGAIAASMFPAFLDYPILVPDFLCNFFHESQLLPLILVCEEIAFFGGSKSALRA